MRLPDVSGSADDSAAGRTIDLEGRDTGRGCALATPEVARVAPMAMKKALPGGCAKILGLLIQRESVILRALHGRDNSFGTCESNPCH